MSRRRSSTFGPALGGTDQSAESDEERREIALEIGALDGRRHADIYAALEDE